MRSSKTVKPGFLLCSLPFTRKTWARREPVPACHSWSELGLVNDILCLSLETPAGRTRFKPTLGRPCRERKFGLILAEGIFILNLCHFVPFSGLFQSYGMWLYTPGMPWGPWDNHSCFLKLQMASFCLSINKSCQHCFSLLVSLIYLFSKSQVFSCTRWLADSVIVTAVGSHIFMSTNSMILE